MSLAKVDQYLQTTHNLSELLTPPAVQNLPLGDEPTKLPLTTQIGHWESRDRGEVISKTVDRVQLLSPTRYESWPKGAPADGDYIQYGETTAALVLGRENWEDYNQLYFQAEAKCTNVINPNVTLSFKNDGKVKIPDQYLRDGFHSIDLANNQSNLIVVDISDLPRDAITEIALSTAANGSYLNLPGQIDLTFSNFRLAKTVSRQTTHGWKPTPGRIVVSQMGYGSSDKKVAIMAKQDTDQSFSLVNVDTGKVMLTKKWLEESVADDAVLLAGDFSDYTETGTYRIQSGRNQSTEFQIRDQSGLWSASVFKTMNFIFSERCGYPVPRIHGTCHADVYAKHKEMVLAFNGGWHDAGDLSQQTVQTAEVALSLAEAAHAYRSTNEALSVRLDEESRWGFDFVLKTRFGDGYRATSAGTSRWTDNCIGNFDDVRARVHNNPYENYLFAGIEGRAAQLTDDDTWRKRLIQVAVQDFAFAEVEFAKKPYAPEKIMWEHTYNTSKATYHATVAWSAAILFETTKGQQYYDAALAAGKRLCLCQEHHGIRLDNGDIVRGIFYRDEQHKVFQHFNHQSREHLFAAALAKMIAITSGETREKFRAAARSYGDSLLYLQQFTKPYPMISAGLYRDDEYRDHDSFYHQHLLVDESAEIEFRSQLKKGIRVAPHIYIKRFPVWFSFRGNNGVLLSTGISAAILGHTLRDHQLIQLAIDQLNWVTGLNPFDQSLMLGLGTYFQTQYAVSSGQQVGELPVGIETLGDEDIPYWPSFNNATYKEVWIANDGKWLSLIANVLGLH